MKTHLASLVIAIGTVCGGAAFLDSTAATASAVAPVPAPSVKTGKLDSVTRDGHDQVISFTIDGESFTVDPVSQDTTDLIDDEAGNCVRLVDKDSDNRFETPGPSGDPLNDTLTTIYCYGGAVPF